MNDQTIDRCPVCKSTKLEQNYAPAYISNRIGGEHTSSPRGLDGCTCNNCGTKNEFNVKGTCPNCKGTGEYKEYCSSGGIIHEYSMSYKCPTCNGKGVL